MKVEYVKTSRDLIIFRLSGKYITISCDSCGAVGFNPLDKVKVDGRRLGRYLARVALMETLSAGAHPVACALSLAINPDHQLDMLVEGVKCELKAADAESIPLILSSEKNFSVEQTGVGISVVGVAERLKIRKAHRGDLVIAVGRPCTGIEVLQAEERCETATLRDLAKLLRMRSIHEVIPVGSQGILHEAKVLAEDSDLEFKLKKDVKVDVKRSAGPSTVILIAAETNIAEKLPKILGKPVEVVGRLM